MKTTTKSLATATLAATALAGVTFAVAPTANATETATKNFSVSFSQNCTLQYFGGQTLGAKVTGTVPTAVKRGAAFNLTNASIQVTVPSGLNAQAYAAGARYQKVTFQVVNINNTKITPATVDAVRTNITTAFVPVPNGQPSNFRAPTTGGLTVPLKAGTTAGTGILKAGAVKATFTLYSAAKTPIISNATVNCAATNKQLTTVTIN